MIVRKPFYFLRHGETAANVNDRFCGIHNCPLNDKGVDQAVEVASYIARLSIDSIFFSPLKRAKNTAKIVAIETSSKLIQKKSLQECNFGILEKQKITKETQKIIKKWLNGETPRKGEAYAAFARRIKNVFNECLNSSNKPPLFVSHGGVFMTLTNEYLGHTPPVELANCGLIYLEPEIHGKWTITGLNKNCFLKPHPTTL